MEDREQQSVLNLSNVSLIQDGVKEIKIPKSEMIKEGDNGVTVPSSYEAQETLSIGFEDLRKIILQMPNYKFYTSNQQNPASKSGKLVTFSASNKNTYIFINLYYVRSSKASLCEDISYILVGSEDEGGVSRIEANYRIPDQVVLAISNFVFEMYTAYLNQDLNFFNRVFFPKQPSSFLERVLNTFLGDPHTLSGTFEEDSEMRFLVSESVLNSKNISIYQTYP